MELKTSKEFGYTDKHVQALEGMKANNEWRKRKDFLEAMNAMPKDEIRAMKIKYINQFRKELEQTSVYEKSESPKPKAKAKPKRKKAKTKAKS